MGQAAQRQLNRLRTPSAPMRARAMAAGMPAWRISRWTLPVGMCPGVTLAEAGLASCTCN